MEEFQHKIEGDVSLSSDLRLRGMVTGSVTVPANVVFELNGMIGEDLICEPGSVVRIHGTVIGSVVNDGGQVEIWGVVGSIDEKQSGSTIVHPGAVVGLGS